MNWIEYEQNALSKGYKAICGVDEAGRGPLAEIGRASCRERV